MVITKQEMLRREVGMSKADLAREAKVSACVIGWIESGRFKPYPIQMHRIAQVLNWDGDPTQLLEAIEVSGK